MEPNAAQMHGYLSEPLKRHGRLALMACTTSPISSLISPLFIRQ